MASCQVVTPILTGRASLVYNFNMTSPLFTEAELAGMVGEDGVLGTGQFLEEAHPPRHARLEGNKILWSWGGTSMDDARRPSNPKGMLDAFVRIKNAADILRFVLKYGVLVVCEHGLPVSHNLKSCVPLVWEKASWSPETGTARQETLWAPLETWLSYVRLAKSLLSLAGELHRGQRGAAEDWDIALRTFLPPDNAGKVGGPIALLGGAPVEDVSQVLAGAKAPYYPFKLSWGPYYLSQVVDAWLSYGNVRPRFWWSPTGNPSFSLLGTMPSCVFAPLGVQLMLAIARSNAVALCSGCGTPYLRQGRQPQPGQRNYCPNCGERVANRDRQRSWRMRKQLEKQKGGQG